MRILALETSGRHGSISLLEFDGGAATVLIACELPAGERTARSLLPSVEEALRDQGWQPADLELVAVTTGPGSFTGLRIGVVAAKTLAYALGAPLVGVHTLAAMAENAPPLSGEPPTGRLWTILDAQRQELFAANFDGGRPVVDQSEPTTDVSRIEDWLARLSAGDAVAGPPLAKLADRLPGGVTLLPEQFWQPSAAAVGRLGFELFQRGVSVPALELVPNYYRKSAAEEKHGAALRSADYASRLTLAAILAVSRDAKVRRSGARPRSYAA